MRRIFYHFMISACFLLAGLGASAQSLNWTNMGPDNLGSKTRAITFDQNGNLIAGSAGGGLFRSEDGGQSWSPIQGFNNSDAVSCLVVTDVLVANGNIYVATGETQLVTSIYHQNEPSFDVGENTQGFVGYSGLPGQGVYVSSDNGETFSNENATTTAFPTANYQGPFVGIQRLAASGSRVFVATREGLYYTEDNFATLSPISVRDTGGVSVSSSKLQTSTVFDVEIGEGNTVFASTRDTIYVSRDGGNSFEGLNQIFPLDLAPATRLAESNLQIAVAPSQPSTVYAAGATGGRNLSGVWRSDDNGASWYVYSPSENAGFTPLQEDGVNAFAFEVYPDNPDEVIVAGAAWYTFTSESGWTQSAQHVSASVTSFIPTSIYSIAFDPNDSNTLYIGTDKQVTFSRDRAESFITTTKGYEGCLTTGVASFGIQDSAGTDLDVIIAGTAYDGTLYNRHALNNTGPSPQGFGDIHSPNYAKVFASSVYPGATLTQHSDRGIRRSLVPGNPFEVFYGFPLHPVETRNLSLSDTIIDRRDDFADATSPTVNVLYNRNNSNGILSPILTQYVLDEVVPDDAILTEGKDSIQSKIDPYIFFCSADYVWIVYNPFGSPPAPLPRWERLTNDLLSPGEYFTAITVSGDTNHTVYVGSSRGKLFRIDRPHIADGYDGEEGGNVIRLDQSGGLPDGRWVTSLAVDPLNTNSLIVTYSGYQNISNPSGSAVYYTDDAEGLPFFSLLTSNLTAPFPVYSSRYVYDPATETSQLLIGSDRGLYYVSDIQILGPGFATSTWAQETNIPRVPIYDINVRPHTASITDIETEDFILEKDNTVLLATFGAGIYATTDLRYNREGNDEDDTEIPTATHVKFYPNPSYGMSYVDVALTGSANVSVELFGLDGRSVRAMGYEVEAGMHTFDLSTEGLVPGVYFVKVLVEGTSDNFVQTFKAVIAE